MAVNNIGAVSERVRIFESVIRLFCKRPEGISEVEVTVLHTDLNELNPQWWLNLHELCHHLLLDAEITAEKVVTNAVSLVARPDFPKDIGGSQVYEYLLQIFSPEEDDVDVFAEMYNTVEACFTPPDTDSDTDSDAVGPPRVVTRSPPFAPPPPPRPVVEPMPATKSDPPADFSTAQRMMASANQVMAEATVLKLKAEVAMGRAEQMKEDLEQQKREIMLGYSDTQAVEAARKFLASLDITKADPEFLDCLDMGKVVLKGTVALKALSLQYKALLSESDGLQGDIRAENAKVLVLLSDLRKRAAEKERLIRLLDSFDIELADLRQLIKGEELAIAEARAKHEKLNPLVAELQEETYRLEMLLEEEQLRAAAQRRTTEAGVANARAEIASCKQQEAEAREQLNTALAELDAKVECDRATYEQAVEECAAECDRLNGLIQEALEQVKFMRAQAEAKILSGKEDAGDMFARLDKMLQRLAELVNPS